MSYRILVIEDNLDMLENIASILELGHYDVLTAENGKIGVEVALREKPDLILCDIMMPELDGYGVLHILGRNPATSTTPFVFLTAKTDLTHIREGMMLGADDYLTKPFDDSELLSVLEMRIKKHEHIKATFDEDVQSIDDFLSKAREVKGTHSISENLQSRKIARRNFVFMEGHEPLDLFYIKSGLVKTYMMTEDGKELVTGIHGPEQFIGYLSLLEQAPYNESAIVLEDAEVVMINQNDFNNLVYSNRMIATRFIKLLADNLYEVESRLLEMAYQSVRQRVASSLVKLTEQQVCKEGNDSVVKISRKDLSGIVGTATESLNRTLADFRDEKILELTDSGIRVLDHNKLKRAAH